MRIFPLSAAFAFLLTACGAEAPDMNVVSDVDVAKYEGTWHEIASIPNSFQKQCVSDTTANYTLNDDGTIAVLNSCKLDDGSFDEADGRARFTGGPGEGKLEVSFASVLGVQLWFAGGDYWIIALDESYGWSLVGNPSRDYAWILAREPSLPLATLVSLETALKQEGYDPCRLIVTSLKQAAGGPTLCEAAAGP